MKSNEEGQQQPRVTFKQWVQRYTSLGKKEQKRLRKAIARAARAYAAQGKNAEEERR